MFNFNEAIIAGNIVTIDGSSYKIDKALPNGINAVKYSNRLDYAIEETENGINNVSKDKYFEYLELADEVRANRVKFDALFANKLTVKEQRYNRLSEIFVDKWYGIMKLIIDKPYMNDRETILAQIKSYEELYKAQLKILEKEPDNEYAQLVVKKHDEAVLMQAEANKFLQIGRKIIEDKIENNSPDVDDILNYVESLRFAKDDLKDSKKFEAIIKQIKGS